MKNFRTPESWLNHGLIEGIRHPIPGEAFVPVSKKNNLLYLYEDPLNNLYRWFNVAVTDYLPDKKLWRVLTLDGFQRPFSVPRIYLMFKAEDPKVFAQRIQAALELRHLTESNIR